MRTKVLSTLLCATLLLTAGQPASWSREPLTLTTIEQENKMGEDAYREILKKEKVSKDKEINLFVRRVANRIAAAAPDKGFKYEVSVLDSDKINAFCLPGGKICVYTGILPYCQNEAGLACVMGHEVAHAILRHGGQRMTQHTAVGVAGSILEKILQAKKVGGTVSKVAMGAYGYGAQLGILLPYSRSHETEADDAGLEYMAKAGYDPAEAPRFWQRFGTLKSNVPTFFSTHPAHDNRAERLTKGQEKARVWYANSPKYGLGEMIPKRYLKPIKGVPQTQPGGQAPAAVGSAPAPAKTQGLSDGEIRTALREALTRGARRAVSTLRKEEGFLDNADVRLNMPEALRGVEAAVRKAGKKSRIEDFLKNMNRAAAKAVKEHDKFVFDAVKAVTFDRPRPVLNGAPDAATQHLRRLTGAGLRQEFLSVIEDINRKAGATKCYVKMVRRGGKENRKVLQTFNLNTYVADGIVAAIMSRMAAEERRIRARPNALQSETMKRVFGAAKR